MVDRAKLHVNVSCETLPMASYVMVFLIPRNKFLYAVPQWCGRGETHSLGKVINIRIGGGDIAILHREELALGFYT